IIEWAGKRDDFTIGSSTSYQPRRPRSLLPRTHTGLSTDGRMTVGSYRHEVSERTAKPLAADPRPFSWNADDSRPRFFRLCRMEAGIQAGHITQPPSSTRESKRHPFPSGHS